MVIPSEAAVMILPNVLFPQALLPLHIYEPRYRRMVADALTGERMFIVAMQKAGQVREVPSSVAGLGIIRVCVKNPDGTYHLILQGIARVELMKVVRYKPYRCQGMRELQASPNSKPEVDALLERIRNLVGERLKLGSYPFHSSHKSQKGKEASNYPSVKEIIGYMKQLTNPEELADLISCALLPGVVERQAILEAVELEPRLNRLIDFLSAEIRNHRKRRGVTGK